MRRLRELCQLLNPELLAALRRSEADELIFTYRWFLVDFKRECEPAEVRGCGDLEVRRQGASLATAQALQVWERLWAARICASVHMPVAMAYVRLNSKAYVHCVDWAIRSHGARVFSDEVAACTRDGSVLKLFNSSPGHVVEDVVEALNVLQEVEQRQSRNEW